MDTFQVKIIRMYSDMNGTILSKLAVPTLMQQKVPFYLFNLFDKNSGFLAAQKVTPPMPGMYFLYSYVKGTSYNFLDYQIGNTINQMIQNGDLILVYADDPILPNFLCNIIIHCDYVSYAGFLDNLKDRSISIPHFQHVTDNPNNWSEAISTTLIDDFGLVTNDKITVTPFRDPNQQSLGFIDVTQPINVTDKQGLNSYILFDTESLELDFYIDSIVPITNISNNGNKQTSNQAVLFKTQ